MRKPVSILISLLVFFASHSFAQKGKDGAKVINSNTIVNEYTSLTNDAPSGSTFITVNNSALNTNGRFNTPLGPGDLIMIIQMQGASINGTATDSTWGEVTNYNNCGLYEFSEVVNVPDVSTINIGCSLKNSYTAAGKVQVVRVPRYSSLIVNGNDTLSCDAWDSVTGGIVAVEVRDSTIIKLSGAIDASGKGFRGGALTSQSSTPYNIQTFVSSAESDGGQKGEGIAGYQAGYNIYGGMFGKGAAANGGGGGNSINTGGGGGANAGDINSWTGNGNPDISNSSWIAAWNLEYNGFANSTSSGGGKGGYSWAAGNVDPLIHGPGDSLWGGDNRRDNGGRGGRPLDYSTGRIFLGGGGGAGHQNDGDGGAGGTGGGIIYLLSYGTVNGTGNIISNGSNGGNSTFLFNIGSDEVGGDGAGGGGSGGTILLNSIGNITGISAEANAGAGGSQVITSSIDGEGTAGGGGGGYIAISNGAISRQATGANNGITGSSLFTAFPSDGATKGGDGTADAVINSSPFSSLIINVSSNVSICNGSNTLLSATGGGAYSWSPSTGLSDSTISNPIASPTITTTYVVSASNGSCSAKDSVVITVLTAIVINAIPDTTICGGSTVTLNAGSSSYSYSWSPTSGLNDSTISNPVASPAVTTTYTYKVSNGSCSDSGSVVVTIGSSFHSGTLSAIKDTICSGTIAHLTTTGSLGTLQWQSGESINGPFINISGASGVNYASQPVSHTTYYRVLAGSGNCTDTSAAFKITTIESPVADYTSSTTGQTISFSSASTGAISYTWDFGDGKTSTEENPAHTYDSAGTYHVCLTVKNNTNCTFTSCKNVSVFADGVNDINAGTEWILYPNPVNNELTITGNQPGSTLQNIEIYDVLGREVMNINEEARVYNPLSINVSGLAPGIYYVKIRTHELNFIKPIIKQ